MGRPPFVCGLVKSKNQKNQKIQKIKKSRNPKRNEKGEFSHPWCASR